MTTEVRLGKIQRVRYGYGGYDNAMFGVTFDFRGDGWGVGDFWGWWPLTYARSEHCKWTEEGRNAIHLDTQRKLEQVMSDAKVHDVTQLVDVPVEVKFEGNSLESWRVLKEVL